MLFFFFLRLSWYFLAFKFTLRLLHSPSSEASWCGLCTKPSFCQNFGYQSSIVGKFIWARESLNWCCAIKVPFVASRRHGGGKHWTVYRLWANNTLAWGKKVFPVFTIDFFCFFCLLFCGRIRWLWRRNYGSSTSVWKHWWKIRGSRQEVERT